MRNYQEVKEIIKNLPLTAIYSAEDQVVIEELATQLGYTMPSCQCGNKYHKQVLKLKKWLEIHKDGFCHYQMDNGVCAIGAKGQTVINITLTDEDAEYIKEHCPNWNTFMRQILEFETAEEPKVDVIVNDTPKKTTKKTTKK